MTLNSVKEVYDLSNQSIDKMSQRFFDILTDLKYENKSKYAIRLNIEEYLLGYQAKFGADTRVVLLVQSKLGELSITFNIEGEEYNPMADEDSQVDEWNSTLMQNLCVTPSVSYANNKNSIRLKLKKPSMNPIFQMLLSVLIGGIIGGLGFLLKASTRASIEELFLNPVSETFLGVLSLVGLMLVLLSVISGVIEAGDMTTFSSIGKRLSIRMMSVMMVIVVVVCGGAFGLFGLNMVAKFTGLDRLEDLLTLILSFVPTNIIAPFYERNPIQIMVVGLAIGIAVLALGNSVKNVGKFFNELYSAELYIMEYVQKFLFVFIGIVVIQIMWTNSTRLLLLMLKVVLACVGACTLVMLVHILITSIYNKISPIKVFKKLLPIFIISLTNSSSSDVYGTFLECCERKLGIDKKLSAFGISFSAGMFKPGTAILYLVASLFFAKVYGIEITPIWLITAVLLCYFMAIATPPITGGSTVSYTLVFMELGIPKEALAIALAVDIIFDFYTAATNRVLTCTSLLNLAKGNGMVNQKKLNK